VLYLLCSVAFRVFPTPPMFESCTCTYVINSTCFAFVHCASNTRMVILESGMEQNCAEMSFAVWSPRPLQSHCKA
jgi:hypothetical protein